jgi:hypothetical protein
VPFLDASGAIAVHELLVEAERAGIRIILCGVRRDLLRTLRPLLDEHRTGARFARNYDAAIKLAAQSSPRDAK